MTEAVAIIKRHITEADRARIFHKNRGPRLGNVEATVAALKIAWLKDLLREIEGK